MEQLKTTKNKFLVHLFSCDYPIASASGLSFVIISWLQMSVLISGLWSWFSLISVSLLVPYEYYLCFQFGGVCICSYVFLCMYELEAGTECLLLLLPSRQGLSLILELFRLAGHQALGSNYLCLSRAGIMDTLQSLTLYVSIGTQNSGPPYLNSKHFT